MDMGQAWKMGGIQQELLRNQGRTIAALAGEKREEEITPSTEVQRECRELYGVQATTHKIQNFPLKTRTRHSM
jgi:hypothetical protein